MKSSKYESIYLPSQWCFIVVLDWSIFCTCCGFGVLSEIRYMKRLHINDMKLDNDLGIDTPGGNLNFVRNIKAQTTALNRAIT